MSFRKPFKAVPIKPGPRHRRNPPEHTTPRVPLLLQAALLGSVIGIGSLAFTANGRAILSAGLRPAAAPDGQTREPQAGDYWENCAAARRAGVSSINASEPGYRDDMDGDGDGVACEPYNGY
ncbi:excalibur calcium-binding domain-containing protein [Novosphingobium ginsenosidimutans]|uniref:Excalibur calcium-binding domain-containing protein n=1 Tax=Novosphingobium ginsenosidimutans TaxID=1176536 RepID=A0A5B8S1Y9_9SPHN|nr:excalibur calcium-binding domain-containing protein [Novosphingobium ginsenosidimutans]QEA15526.1 hypothetical protein FRF71_04900 [Novosphingobium ginsenosidimutans]